MHPTRALRGAGLTALATLTTLSSLALVASPAGATSTTKTLTGLASVATNGVAGNGTALGSQPSIGARFVAFSSSSSNLVPGDTNGKADVFVRDTLAATTTRVSVPTAGGQANGDSDQAQITANGRYVVYRSSASNLVGGDSNGATDIFWRDTWTGTTKRVNLADASINQALGGDSSYPAVSDDGADVAFQSNATNLVGGDTNGVGDVFTRNIGGAFTERLSVTSGEGQLTKASSNPSSSGNGRYVVFESLASQIGTDTNNTSDIFLRDRVLGTTERVSVANDESQATAYSQFASVSDDGRYVAFESGATGLANDADVAGEVDVFRRDRTNGVTILATRTNTGLAGNKGGTGASMSSDGSKISFSSSSTNLVGGDTNGVSDVFVRDLLQSTTVRSSVKTLGGQLGKQSYGGELSPDGGSVSFTTGGDDGYGTDTNGFFDVYWRGSFQLGPFSDSTGLVQRNVADFGASLTFGQRVALNDRILNGTASPSSIIDDLAHGTFDDHRAPVMRLYWSFFHRIPDQGGMDYWVKKHTNGVKLKTIAANFAGSPEFKNTYGTLNNTQFVTLVYQNVLGRDPEAGGLAHWVQSLDGGASRGDVMTAFSESSEGKRLMRAEVDSFLITLGMFGRLPTPGEFASDLNVLDKNGGQPTEVVILGNLQLGIYANRVA